MAEVSPSLSVITLNANGLNSPIKRQRMAEWIINKHDPTTWCLKETHFGTKESESEWMENILNANSNQERDVYINKRNNEL